MHYNKLVRDNIPEIIRASGRQAEVRELNLREFQEYLDIKLQEELNEYLVSGDVEELADLVEVVQAIVIHKGITPVAFEKIRLAKRQERGGFEKRLLLIKVQDESR